ncbi:MAG: transporter substrate-binding domain-containing protein [Holophaga sp.]|nr:transporter substrate-binding domain-containing protein [Holophaga sp.]
MRAFSFFPRIRPYGWGRRCLVILLVTVSALLAAQEPLRLRVGVDTDYPPFEWVDTAGRPQGYTVELLRAVAKSQNLAVDFYPMGWRELRTAFARGELDVLTGMAPSERRLNTIDFSIPHSTLNYSILTRVGETRIRSERDLAGKLILSEEGDVLHEYLVAQGLKVQGVSSPREALAMLSGGTGDCAVVPRLMWLYQEKAKPTPNLRVVPSELFPAKYCFAVPKGQEALLAKLNEGLFLAKQNGTMDALQDRYLGSLEAADLSLKMALRRALPSLFTGILALGLAVALGWSLALRRAVKLKTAALKVTIGELEGALAEVKQLSGLIPMCAGCKKIRDDGGYWEAVEAYLGRHSEAQFTHGLCPDCVQVYFPDFRKATSARVETSRSSE